MFTNLIVPLPSTRKIPEVISHIVLYCQKIDLHSPPERRGWLQCAQRYHLAVKGVVGSNLI